LRLKIEALWDDEGLRLSGSEEKSDA